MSDTYYKERVSPHTNTVTESLSVFLSWLFTSYGEIDRDAISEQQKKVLEIAYNMQDPMTKIFEPIQELEQLAIAGRRPYTQEQLVDFGVSLITATNDFETALIEWHNLPPLNQTWQTFKNHFSSARRNLKKVRGRTMRSAGFHQANIMAASIDEFRNEILESVRQVQDNVITAVNTPSSQFEDMLPPPNETANAVVANSDISGLVTMINTLATTVQNMQQSMQNTGTGRGGRAGGARAG
jgi:hypothetical protein